MKNVIIVNIANQQPDGIIAAFAVKINIADRPARIVADKNWSAVLTWAQTPKTNISTALASVNRGQELPTADRSADRQDGVGRGGARYLEPCVLLSATTFHTFRWDKNSR